MSWPAGKFGCVIRAVNCAVGSTSRRLLDRRAAPWTVILGVTCLGGFLLGVRLNTPHPSEEPVNLGAAGLVVDSDVLDFGEVLAQRDFQWTIPVRNTSPQDATIAEIESSCGCTAIEPLPLTIPAGESRDVRVTMDLTFRSASDAEKPSWPFDVMLEPVVEVAGEQQRMKWRLEGRVKSWVNVFPPMVLLGERSIRGESFPAQIVDLRFEQPVSKVTAERRSSLLQASVTKLGNDGRRYQLEIGERSRHSTNGQLNAAEFPLGRIETKVTVSAVDAKGNSLPQVEVPVSGRITTDVEAVPESIMLGIQPAGETVTAQVSLRSRTGREFTVQQVASESAALKFQPVESVSAAIPSFKLIQQIEGDGFQSADVVFHVRHADGFEEEVRVPVRYVGTEGNQPP